MRSFAGIHLGEKFYSSAWILENYRNLDRTRLKEYEVRTLSFCGQWLSGVERFVVHTSGSTGAPKAIHLRRQQMELSARLTGEVLNLRPGDRALVCLSPAYIGGLMMLVRGLVLGLDLTVVEPKRNPFGSLKAAGHATFDFTALVPLQLQSILESGLEHLALLNQMKAVLVGGAPVSVELLKELQRVEAPVFHTFGMTETVSHIALRRLNGPEASECYHPLPGVEIGTDDRGCLTIKAPVTDRRLVATNDLVEIQPDGSFVWLGRIDNVINTGGVKVCAEKVERALEEVLHELGRPRAFFVGPMPDSRLGEAVTAVLEGHPFSEKVIRAVQEKLSLRLGKYELPRKYRFLEALVRTPTGKIDRRANLLKARNQRV